MDVDSRRVINHLLDFESKYTQNILLLKKIIAITYLGRLQINGLAPDKDIILEDYLFDDERIIFDYTRLSPLKKEQFTAWLLDPHQKEKEYSEINTVTVNEYRGFTAEVALNWWGIIKKFFGIGQSEYWTLSDRSLTLEYQLLGIEISHGKQGILIGFSQSSIPASGAKYTDPKYQSGQSLGNTKRVFITDRLVDQVLSRTIERLNPRVWCKEPHPFSTKVPDSSERIKQMNDYRNMQKFEIYKPWYQELWEWIVSWFVSEKPVSPPKPIAVLKPEDTELNVLYSTKTVEISERQKTKEIMFKEKKPDIEYIVFCGGGPKIFGHVGVCRALNEAQIKPKHFAGSSAGAIISLLCYLGYNAEEINEIFSVLRQEHIVYMEFDINGVSDARSLKTALDFAVAKKIAQITTKYNIPYPKGPITFDTLDKLRRMCEQKGVDCGLGKSMVITATNISQGTTKYFSQALTPNYEVTDAVKISSSVPLVFRSTLIDGEAYNDGGMLSNFPTEAFSDDHSTLLESEFGNNLKLLAIQFDTGTERDTIDKGMDEVYRENVFLNFIYGIMSGISDPATGWEQDRLKLRKYASQSVVVNLDDVPVSFAVSQETRNMMANNGYQATNDYLEPRYLKGKDGAFTENDELMYETFNSLGDLLAFCCYRGEFEWFKRVTDLIVHSWFPNKADLVKKSLKLKELYFNDYDSLSSDESHVVYTPSFFGNAVIAEDKIQYPDILLIIYPVFLRLSADLLKNNVDKNYFELARHAISINDPFACLNHLDSIKGEAHIVLFIAIDLIKELKKNPANERILEQFKVLQSCLNTGLHLSELALFGTWSMSSSQSLQILNLMSSSSLEEALLFISTMNKPQIDPVPELELVFCDDQDEHSTLSIKN